MTSQHTSKGWRDEESVERPPRPTALELSQAPTGPLRVPSPALPLNLFSPLPSCTRPAQNVPTSSTYTTSSQGQITPPASPTPPSANLVIDPEPITPRKAPPTPGSAPPSPAEDDDVPLRHRQYRRESSALEDYAPERLSFSPPASPSRRIASWPDAETRRVAFAAVATQRASLEQRAAIQPQESPSPTDSHPSTPAASSSSPNPAQRASDPTAPRLELSRTDSTTIHPGSSVPLALRAFNFLPSPFRPYAVSIVFTGTSRIVPSPSPSSSTLLDSSPPPSEHRLFRLEAQVVLDGPLWTGSITVPTSCRCLSCGAGLETLPWTFSYEDGESGTRFETVFRVEATARALSAQLEIEVLPRPSLPDREGWLSVAQGDVASSVKGQLRGLALDEANLFYRPSSTPPSLAATADVPLLLQAVLRFRRLPSFSSTDLAALLPLLSPSHSSFTLLAVLSSPGLGESSSRPIGGSWTSASSLDSKFRLEVDASSAERLSVTIQLPLLPKAVVFASAASCAGFAVGFQLQLDIGSYSRSTFSPLGHLRLSTPFLPAPFPLLPAPSTPPIPSPLFPTSDITSPEAVEDVGRRPRAREEISERRSRWWGRLSWGGWGFRGSFSRS